MKSKTVYFQGMLGGFIVIALLMTLLISINFFNYRIRIEKIIINTASNKAIINDKYTYIYNLQKEVQDDLLFKLKSDSYILTPSEYTNNIVGYYNNMLLILSLMLGGFSFLSFIYIKSHASDLIQEKINSKEFQENVGYKIAGEVEGRIREEISSMQEKIKDLENRNASSDSDSGNNREIM